MCMSANEGITGRMFLFHVLGIMKSISKSIMFNIFTLIIGFVLGFYTMQKINHVNWKKNPNYECVNNLEMHLKQQRILDGYIDNEIKQLKMRMLHEKYHKESN